MLGAEPDSLVSFSHGIIFFLLEYKVQFIYLVYHLVWKRDTMYDKTELGTHSKGKYTMSKIDKQ
jgi:hypothetical protein